VEIHETKKKRGIKKLSGGRMPSVKAWGVLDEIKREEISQNEWVKRSEVQWPKHGRKTTGAWCGRRRGEEDKMKDREPRSVDKNKKWRKKKKVW